jgi:hypothetical protein
LFAFYVTNFAGYAKTYGALGGVVVLLMWFFISSIVVIVGAQINAEMERQTVKDTTDARDAPLGRRGAFAADTVGPPAAAGKAAPENEHVSQRARASPEEVVMSTNPNTLDDSAGATSDASAFVEKAAGATNPSRSTVGRITAAASAISLGARALPAGLRLFRRYPVASGLVVAGLIWAALAARPQRSERG